MRSTATQRSTYALGHSQQELHRLSRQAQAYEPFTRQLFLQAGIAPGMRVLDVGCGGGDVAFLVANLVGPGGEVVGTDRASSAIQWAISRAQFRSMSNIRFLEGDPTEMSFDEPFDAVVGRLILMYYPDPVAALRKLQNHLCPSHPPNTSRHRSPRATRPRTPSGLSRCRTSRTYHAHGFSRRWRTRIRRLRPGHRCLAQPPTRGRKTPSRHRRRT